MNENGPHDNNNISDDLHPNVESSKEKKKRLKKRIKKFLRNHCNKSRIILFLLFVAMIAAIIILAIFVTRNPSIFLRPHCKAPYGAEALNSTFNTLGQLETGTNYNSNNEYSVVNSLGFTGKYQFVEQTLKELGYYVPKDNTYYKNGSDKNYWLGNFTGKNGCNSYRDFLDNKFNVQEIAIREEFQMDLEILKNSLSQNHTLESFTNKTLKFIGCNVSPNGVSVSNITIAGILAAAHLVGAVNVASALTSGNAPCDEKGTSMTRYLTDFDECNFSVEQVIEAVNSFKNNNPEHS